MSKMRNIKQKRTVIAALLLYLWEVQTVKMKALLYQIKPPCKKCPYKLGQVRTLRNPCPRCKADSYSAYERFKSHVRGGNKHG